MKETRPSRPEAHTVPADPDDAAPSRPVVIFLPPQARPPADVDRVDGGDRRPDRVKHAVRHRHRPRRRVHPEFPDLVLGPRTLESQDRAVDAGPRQSAPSAATGSILVSAGVSRFPATLAVRRAHRMKRILS